MSEKIKRISKFQQALDLNVSDKVEKKNGLSYLSWSYAWAEFKKIYHDGKYEVLKNDYGLPNFNGENGSMVYTKVSADGETHEMWLPVLDYRNKPIPSPNTFDVNKAVMRCLTKNLAMFGIGLYIYSGEDLPESEKKEAMKKSWAFNDKMKTHIASKKQAGEQYADVQRAINGIYKISKKQAAEIYEYWESLK